MNGDYTTMRTCACTLQCPGCTTPQYNAPQYATPSLPSIQEQLGIDPISKLAAAINRLAEVLEKR